MNYCRCPFCNTSSRRHRNFGKYRRNSIHTIARFIPGRVRHVYTCQATGCGKPTTKGKPYCVDHVDLMPYAKEVVVTQEAIGAELSAVGQGKDVIQPDSIIIRDIIKIIEVEGEVTRNDIALAIGLPLDTVLPYIDNLQKWRMISVGAKRSDFVHLDSLFPRAKVGLQEMGRIIDLHPSTIRKLLLKGAPHSKGKRKLQFDPEAFRYWYEIYRKQTIAEQRKHLKKIKEKRVAETKKRVRKAQGSKAKLLTRDELAKALKVSAHTVSHWIRNGVPHAAIEDVYIGGHEGNKLRLFDAEEVKKWRRNFRRRAARRRGTAQAYPAKFWKKVMQHALEHGLDAAAEEFKVAEGTLRRKMNEAGIERPSLQPISDRTLGPHEVAEQLGIRPVTIYKWLREGAPHDRVAHRGRELLLVNAEELQTWNAGSRKNAKVNAQKDLIVEFLKVSKGRCSSSTALTKHLGVSKDIIKNRINDLMAEKRVVITGSGRTTLYCLVNKKSLRRYYG